MIWVIDLKIRATELYISVVISFQFVSHVWHCYYLLTFMSWVFVNSQNSEWYSSWLVPAFVLCLSYVHVVIISISFLFFKFHVLVHLYDPHLCSWFNVQIHHVLSTVKTLPKSFKVNYRKITYNIIHFMCND